MQLEVTAFETDDYRQTKEKDPVNPGKNESHSILHQYCCSAKHGSNTCQKPLN